jgi:hypothetical protein
MKGVEHTATGEREKGLGHKTTVRTNKKYTAQQFIKPAFYVEEKL